MTKFTKITVCLDMAGCPNRCRHCWVGHAPNAKLRADDLRFVAEEFRPFAQKFEIVSWYREPDFPDGYKDLRQLENELSDSRTVPHWELCSFWRTVRDEEYVPWLASLDVKTCQLTLFGSRETTDFWVGRRDAYDEIIKTIDILFENGIAPRIQSFLFKNNAADLQAVEDLIVEKRLIERCAEIGTPFSALVHQGSCDGETARRNGLYDLRPTAEEVVKIPPLLTEYSLKHWNTERIIDVFGKTERELYELFENDSSTKSSVSDVSVFYLDGNLDVYPNLSEPSKYWKLGNLKIDGTEKILEKYIQNGSPAQYARANISLGEMARKHGDRSSLRLFDRGDYEMYLLDKYLLGGVSKRSTKYEKPRREMFSSRLIWR